MLVLNLVITALDPFKVGTWTTVSTSENEAIFPFKELTDADAVDITGLHNSLIEYEPKWNPPRLISLENRNGIFHAYYGVIVDVRDLKVNSGFFLNETFWTNEEDINVIYKNIRSDYGLSK